MRNETLLTIKPGSRITFVYGPGESPELRFTTNPVGTVTETGEDRWGHFVIVEFPDGKTEKLQTVRGLDEKGIGAYLAAGPKVAVDTSKKTTKTPEERRAAFSVVA